MGKINEQKVQNNISDEKPKKERVYEHENHISFKIIRENAQKDPSTNQCGRQLSEKMTREKLGNSIINQEQWHLYRAFSGVSSII